MKGWGVAKGRMCVLNMPQILGLTAQILEN